VQSTTTLGSTVPHKPTTTTTVGRRTKLPPARPIPGDGEVEGIIQIPKIGLDIHFVEGVSLEDLKKGPGHYPLTPLPGQFGNAAIAGHRTTYLHPFFRINELGKGDKILVTTLSGLFTYSVTRATRRESHRSVRARSTERPEDRRAHAYGVSPALLGIASHRHSRSAGSE
jgi:sortase (surface protein transpeptidase)